jgi:hypothetical protein
MSPLACDQPKAARNRLRVAPLPFSVRAMAAVSRLWCRLATSVPLRMAQPPIGLDKLSVLQDSGARPELQSRERDAI